MSTTIYFIDLDGTLIREDTGFLTLKLFLRLHPLQIFNPSFICLALFDRPGIKKFLAERTSLAIEKLTYNLPFIVWLKEKRKNHRVVLATGSYRLIAEKIAASFGSLFEAVLATDEKLNNIGTNKLAAIKKYAGDSKIIYAGNSRADLKIWPHVDGAIGVNLDRGIEGKITFMEKF